MAAFAAWGRVVVTTGRGVVRGTWVVGGDGPPDLAVVDALARAQLAARRAGSAVRLVEASDELRALLDLAGLRGQVCGEPEEGEQPGVEEGVELGDPLA